MWILNKFSQLLRYNDLAIKSNDQVKTVVTNILKTGILPQHVAFIMDGNRRFAQSNGMDKFEGHEAGAVSLTKIVETSYMLKIKYITIYAFSIENFKRTKEEVDKLFELLIAKLNLFLDNEETYNKAAQIRIVGNRSLIPEETLIALEKIEQATKVNDELVLNVCFSYTSRDEIAHSVRQTCESVVNDEILINQISEGVIQDNFYFGEDVPGVDLLIRTSGHTRLSDFLIWQVNQNSVIEFFNVNWPDFSDLQYYSLLLKFGYEKLFRDKLEQIKEKYLPVAYRFSSQSLDKEVNLNSLPPPPPLVSILGNEE